ncbi:MAG: PH domain-containing protein [Nitrososphaera sp.]|nr:PH domain-containing protein [Nitrososphaera sp.]
MLTAFLVVLVFLLKDFLNDVFLPVLILIIAIGFLRISNLLVMAQTYTITLGENGITYVIGLFSRKETMIPYSQVTEASYTQGILQRIFGVANLSIDTPGGSNLAIHLTDARYADVKKTLDKIHSLKK